MALAFLVEAQIMERCHRNLCHITFIFGEHLCAIFHTFIHHFMENVRILKNSHKIGVRIQTHCKIIATFWVAPYVLVTSQKITG